MYTLICDGAYSSARNQGGIGIVFLRDDTPILELSKGYKDTTNNRMELTAIIVGLMCVKKPIDSLTIYSDSMYCIGTITQGWKRSKNQDLWRKFDIVQDRVNKLCKNIKYEHIKGHQKTSEGMATYNNICDKLAVEASQRLVL